MMSRLDSISNSRRAGCIEIMADHCSIEAILGEEAAEGDQRIESRHNCTASSRLSNWTAELFSAICASGPRRRRRLGSLERCLQARPGLVAASGLISESRRAATHVSLEPVRALQHSSSLCRSWWTAMFETSVAVPAS